MAVRGFFYNSVNKDRLYNGQDMNEDKAPFYKEGVAYGHLQVTADGESMAVKVDGGSRTGYAYINLHTIHNTTVLELPVSGSNGTLPRIDPRFNVKRGSNEEYTGQGCIAYIHNRLDQCPETQNAYMMQLYIETRCFCDFINGKYTHF